MPHAALRRGALVAWLACCASLPGCAGAEGGGAVATAGRKGFEGWYQGRQRPLSANPSKCRGRTREVWFEVEHGAIEMRDARRRRIPRKRSLLGTVSPDGSVAMRLGDGGRSVAGSIEGDRLTAAAVQDAETIQAAQGGGKPPCAFRYEATLVRLPIAGTPPFEPYP